MAKNNYFNPIDIQAWSRGQMFYYFSKMAPTAYSLNVELDITVLRAALKEQNIKFYPAYLWLVSTMINKLKAPVKGFYTFENFAHSPIFEEPENMMQIIEEDVLKGKTSLGDKH